ncbi:MAG: hypothetical protein M1826_004587 [Phylliscum demangeonii]|nr:MAG: hypothetical protein M1826_004587 [Phylliscum demangeonii]
MASPVDPDDSFLEKVISHRTVEEREAALNQRIHRQYERHQRRLAELLDSNTTLPVTLSSVSVLGAPRTRRSFLETVVKPMLSASRDAPYTLAEALAAVSAGASRLQKFDIFHTPVSIFIDRPPPTDAGSTPTDLAIYYSVREKSRLLLKTGTDLGNTEGSAYGNVLWRNVLGGAETVSVSAALGTRTRSAYSLAFETPVQADPDMRWEAYGVASATRKEWSGHEEALKGVGSRFRWTMAGGDQHELALAGMWRQVTGLAETASGAVRGDAGDSVKSSLSHVWRHDRRDRGLLPARGYLVQTRSELAGWGPLRGDVAFWKTEIESQLALPLPVPLASDPFRHGVTLTTGLRAGLLYPLAAAGAAHAQPSRINDRFFLGGPTDVRGFRPAGLGPRHGPDALGGDLYAAASANLFVPVPRLGPQSPLRLQAFVNAGRLLALTPAADGQPAVGVEPAMPDVRRALSTAVARLFDGSLPSTAAGVGLVYVHPVARFEVNFSLPLVLRRGEEGRKGLSFGVGINFL